LSTLPICPDNTIFKALSGSFAQCLLSTFQSITTKHYMSASTTQLLDQVPQVLCLYPTPFTLNALGRLEYRSDSASPVSDSFAFSMIIRSDCLFTWLPQIHIWRKRENPSLPDVIAKLDIQINPVAKTSRKSLLTDSLIRLFLAIE
jgi:hypothetical protein